MIVGHAEGAAGELRDLAEESGPQSDGAGKHDTDAGQITLRPARGAGFDGLVDIAAHEIAFGVGAILNDLFRHQREQQENGGSLDRPRNFLEPASQAEDQQNGQAQLQFKFVAPRLGKKMTVQESVDEGNAAGEPGKRAMNFNFQLPVQRGR